VGAGPGAGKAARRGAGARRSRGCWRANTPRPGAPLWVGGASPSWCLPGRLFDRFGDGAAELEPFGLGLQLAAELLGAAFSHRELSAVLTAVGSALEPGVVGLKLAIRRDQFPLDKPEGAKGAYKKHQGRLDGLRVHTAAEVAHIVLARNGGLQTGEIARVAALLLLAQIRTEAGIGGVVIHRLATSRKKELAVL
jgi:hypothetical protein